LFDAILKNVFSQSSNPSARLSPPLVTAFIPLGIGWTSDAHSSFRVGPCWGAVTAGGGSEEPPPPPQKGKDTADVGGLRLLI
jgi:hypothetical protein